MVADLQPLFDGDAVRSIKMEENIMPNGETLKKITGDVADEAGEATYRVAASLLVNAVEVEVVNRLPEGNVVKNFINENKQAGEAIISFALAAVLELTPTSALGDPRKRLAYNLRVRSYERLEELLLSATPLRRYIEDEAERAIRLANGSMIGETAERALRLAKGEREPSVQPAAEASEAAEAGAAH
jgi:hypothetical protein